MKCTVKWSNINGPRKPIGISIIFHDMPESCQCQGFIASKQYGKVAPEILRILDVLAIALCHRTRRIPRKELIYRERNRCAQRMGKVANVIGRRCIRVADKSSGVVKSEREAISVLVSTWNLDRQTNQLAYSLCAIERRSWVYTENI